MLQPLRNQHTSRLRHLISCDALFEFQLQSLCKCLEHAFSQQPMKWQLGSAVNIDHRLEASGALSFHSMDAGTLPPDPTKDCFRSFLWAQHQW
eukprot:scaffold102431_cov57-Attheya_sp.AAC.1